MSPVASGGPPHTRSSSVNGGGPVGTTKVSDADKMAASKRVFPHLDDLVSVRPEIDINLPIRKILHEGELLAKQADTHLDFRRPDIALQEYVKASIVAVDIIPRHKDYTTIQFDRGELHRQWAGFTKRINSQHAKFARVKKDIQEDNARSGVQPGGAISWEAAPRTNGYPNGHIRSQSVQQPPTHVVTNGSNIRKKPPIQPKPDALHGNALAQNWGNAETDLAARLARLRSSDPNRTEQDPRIRTQSISILASSSSSLLSNGGSYSTISKPSGPREMPSVPTADPRTTQLVLNVDIPGLPRPPDAIYNSPARNADNAAAANLPSSVVRTSSFHGAAPPISTVGPTLGVYDNRPPGEEYFYQPAHSVKQNGYTSNPQKKIDLPDSTAVTAEQLMDYLRVGTQSLRVLLVDLRSREDFENGHILSQAIICVEPITLRKGVSGEQLGDSMIIAPDHEQSLYEQRDEFDLIVFYDQNSTAVKSTGGSASEDALYHFSKAVYDYGYDKQLKRRPMLLVGGLDAWTDLLGPNSLEASISRSSSPAAGSQPQKSARPLMRTPATRLQSGVPLKRRKTHSSRPLSKEQEALWDETLRQDVSVQSPIEEESGSPDELVYAKTTEDFVRRYPELPAVKESMTSSLPRPPVPSKAPFHNEIVSSVPAPPARPAPALPRQRSSGLSEKGPATTYAHSQVLQRTAVPRGLTGLENPGVHCYMNSAIQALSATPFIRQYLLNFHYPPAQPLPRKENETSNPPQLMVRCMGNVLGHIWSGNYNFITPKTLAEYVNSIHAGKMTDSHLRSYAFGGSSRQHDAGEFLLFILEILNDELNPRRNIPFPKERTAQEDLLQNTLPLPQASKLAWDRFTINEDSIITRKMRCQSVDITRCDSCESESRTFNELPLLQVAIPEPAPTRPVDLAVLIAHGWGQPEKIEQFTCPSCKRAGDNSATRMGLLSMLPDYVLVQINRFASAERRSQTYIHVGETLDLTRAFYGQAMDDRNETDVRRKRPFLYDCYGAIMHSGRTASSGHWYPVLKNLDKTNERAGGWHQFNDTRVKQTTVAELSGSLTTYVLLKRQGSPLP